MALDGWVKGALVPIKSHYCRLITQGSCSLHRYERGLRRMNNSGGGKDAGIHRYRDIRTSLSGQPREMPPCRRERRLIHNATRSDLPHRRRHSRWKGTASVEGSTDPVFDTQRCVQVSLGAVECTCCFTGGLLAWKCMQSPSVGQEPALLRQGES